MKDPNVVAIEPGEQHFLFRPNAEFGARMHFVPIWSVPLSLAIFMAKPTPEELRPSRVELGLLVYHRAIFFILNLDGSYFDMPYAHPDTHLIAPLSAGYGIPCNVSVCDSHGIVRSMATRNTMNKFGNAFIEAVNQQVRNKYTQTEHDQDVLGAYAEWPDPKLMFQETTIREEGWGADCWKV